MARPVFQHELADADFQWLMSTYREAHPNIAVIESTCLPISIILLPEVPALEVEGQEISPASTVPPLPKGETNLR